MTIDELIERSHAMAVEKGWWPEGEQRSVVDQTNNFHAEISESWEEYRAGRMELWFSRRDEHGRVWSDTEMERHYSQTPQMYVSNGWKPEGFFVELADLCIRLADTMGAYEWRRGAEASGIEPDIACLCASLHSSVARMFSGRAWLKNSNVEAAYMIRLCIDSAKLNGVDLLALCELKMAYNATRSHRHGGKRA